MEQFKKELIDKIECFDNGDGLKHPEFYDGYSQAICDVVELIKKFNFIGSSIKLNDIDEIVFEEWKNIFTSKKGEHENLYYINNNWRGINYLKEYYRRYISF